MITQELAHQLFDYRDGALYWKERASRGVYAGDKVGFDHPTGYRRFMFKRKGFAVHRIIWLMHYGDLPNQIDHKAPSNIIFINSFGSVFMKNEK